MVLLQALHVILIDNLGALSQVVCNEVNRKLVTEEAHVKNLTLVLVSYR